MNKIFLGLSLILLSTTATCGNDVWQTLFKQKLVEAKAGNSDAQFDVGSMYQKGRGVKPDRGKAIEWYEKSAALDNRQATTKLVLMQSNQDRFGKELAGAEAGDMESQYNIGNMYTKGIGVNINTSEAIAWFEKSANQGHIKSGFRLGQLFYEGTGIKRNRKTAFKWFKDAAEKDHPPSQYYLGKMYASGHGTRQDYKAALQWLSRSVDGGFNQARGEMIEVKDRMNAKALAKASSKQQVAAKKPDPVAQKKQAVKKKRSTEKSVAVKKSKKSKKSAKAGKPEKQAAAETPFSMEDLMLASWSRNGKPVAYLPSMINSCRTENSKIICYSDDLVRKTGNGDVRFKTKSIITHFTDTGEFSVAYRNLVISSEQAVTYNHDNDDEDIGTLDSGENSYQVKSGWGKSHKLECQMKDASTVACLKNKTYAILLVSPQTLASGR